MRALDSPTCLLADLHGQRPPLQHAKRKFMQSNNVQAVCPDTMPRAQTSPILASDAFHPSAFPMISTFCNGDHIFTKFQHDMHSAGDFKKTPMDSQNGSRVERHPVRVRATSRSTHASHTPPSRTQKRIKHWLATPKASVNCWGGEDLL